MREGDAKRVGNERGLEEFSKGREKVSGRRRSSGSLLRLSHSEENKRKTRVRKTVNMIQP